MNNENITYYLDGSGNLLTINGFYLCCDDKGNNRLLKNPPPELPRDETTPVPSNVSEKHQPSPAALPVVSPSSPLVSPILPLVPPISPLVSPILPLVPPISPLVPPILPPLPSSQARSKLNRPPLVSTPQNPSPQQSVRSLEIEVGAAEDVEVSDNSTPTGVKARWTHSATLYLISTYEEKRNILTSNTIRRTEAWKEVAAQMASAGFTYTADQCDHKFQNLRKVYLKKKDNMAASSSGHERLDFIYFEEFDKLFGKSPIVQPVALASSSRIDHGLSNQDLSNLDTSEDFENMSIEELENLFKNKTKKKGNKKRNIDFVVDAIQDIDAKREKRHNEIVNVLKAGQKDFRDIMTQFMGTLTHRQPRASESDDE